MKRYASTIIEHAWIVETKIIKHWANPSVSEDGGQLVT